MIGYVNNSEIAGGEEKVEESVNMKGTVESNAVLELEEDKQHRMDVIGQSLIISKLEDELDNELKTKFNVKNTEERIRRLKEVLGLLKTSEIKSNHTQKEDSEQSTSAVKDNIDMESEKDFIKCSVGTEEGKKEVKDIRETDVKTNKHVHFELLPEDENEEISDAFKIDVSVGDVVKKVILMGDEQDRQDEDKHRIDDFYVHFPSLQSRAQERIKQLEEQNDKEEGKYCPETEDITDDEEKEKNIVVVCKNALDSKDEGIIDRREVENVEEVKEKEDTKDIKDDKVEDGENKTKGIVEDKILNKQEVDIRKKDDVIVEEKKKDAREEERKEDSVRTDELEKEENERTNDKEDGEEEKKIEGEKERNSTTKSVVEDEKEGMKCEEGILRKEANETKLDKNKDEQEVKVKDVDKVDNVKIETEKTKDSKRLEINTIENGQEIGKMKTIEKEESDDDNAKDDDGKNIKGEETTKSNVDTVDIDSENEDVENAEICKKEEDVKNDLNRVYVEGG